MDRELAKKCMDALTDDLMNCRNENCKEAKRGYHGHCEDCEITWEARANIIQHMEHQTGKANW